MIPPGTSDRKPSRDPFVATPKFVVLALTRGDRGSYATLAGHADRHGNIKARQELLAERDGCSLRTMQRVIERLEELGFIETKRRWVDGKTRNTYRLILTESEAKTVAEAYSKQYATHDASLPQASTVNTSPMTPTNTSPVTPLSRSLVCLEEASKEASLSQVSNDVSSPTNGDQPADQTPDPRRVREPVTPLSDLQTNGSATAALAHASLSTSSRASGISSPNLPLSIEDCSASCAMRARGYVRELLATAPSIERRYVAMFKRHDQPFYEAVLAYLRSTNLVEDERGWSRPSASFTIDVDPKIPEPVCTEFADAPESFTRTTQ